MAGDIRSYLRTCDTVNRGNCCEKDVKLNRETCYSTCRANYCNNFNGELDWPTLSNSTAGCDDTAEIDGPRRNDTAALGGSMTAVGTLVGLGAAVALVHAWP